MKYLIFGFLICLSISVSAQREFELKSNITRVNVFTQGAQVNRSAKLQVQAGQTKLKLTGLSPYVEKESIRINGDGSYAILSVQHQNDYINQLDKDKEIEAIEAKIENIDYNIEDEETFIKVINSKLAFFNSNSEVVSNEKGISSEALISLSAVYGSNVEALHLDLLNRQRKIKTYIKEKTKLNNQLRSLNIKQDLPSGTIIVTIESLKSQTADISFNYLVENASWYPTYDVRFVGVNEPLNVTYKANIKQNTGIDWKDVNVVLSTAKTNLSAKIPELAPFYIDYYYPPLLSHSISSIDEALQGKMAGVAVQQTTGAPGADMKMRIRGGSSINGANDPLYVIDGHVGGDISKLSPSDIERIDILKDASATAVYGSRGNNGVVVVTTKKDGQSSSMPMTITTKQETVSEYVINAKQSILSNDKVSTLSFRNSSLKAEFEYQSVPKLSENVYLIAKIPDWYKANLMSAEVNVYMENAFVGKSDLDTKLFKDTLEVSFGVDNNVSIEREKLSEFSESQFVGSNRKETVAYKINVRNNKPYQISTKVADQIPVSTSKEIQIETLEVSNGQLDTLTGKVEWDITLAPNETKELIIKYSVKYPKNKQVMIE